MSHALLAHVVVSESARFDVEQKVLGRQPLTADDGEMLLALIHDAHDLLESAESERDEHADTAEKAEKERDALEAELDAERAKLALVPDDVQELVEQVEMLTLELRETRVALAELRHAKPYRYVRSARTRAGIRWALWERPSGERARRVGTAHSEDEYRAFLKGA